MEVLDHVLPLYDEFAPDLLLLILGVDTYRSDPPASLELEVDDYFQIGHPLAAVFGRTALALSYLIATAFK